MGIGFKRKMEAMWFRGSSSPTLKHQIKEEAWIALEDQGRNPMEVRRRIRGKVSVKKLERAREEEDEEDSENERPGNQRIMKVIEEEMTTIMGETDQDQMEVTLEMVARLRKMIEENPEEEVLQTRIVGVNEVMMKKEDWRRPIEDELRSLVEEKEALVPLRGEAKEDFFKKAQKEGRKIEVVPGKLVPTIKPGLGGGKKKARIVACGNFTNRDAQDDLYASTGDAVVLRIMMKLASERGLGRDVLGRQDSVSERSMGRPRCIGETTRCGCEDAAGGP